MIYTTHPGYSGFDTFAANVDRGFGRQLIGGSPADSMMCGAHLPDSIGTRSDYGSCGLWMFTEGGRWASVDAHMATSHDAYRRYEVWEDAHAHTGNPLYQDLANRAMNLCESSYGSAMELRYDVQ